MCRFVVVAFALVTAPISSALRVSSGGYVCADVKASKCVPGALFLPTDRECDVLI